MLQEGQTVCRRFSPSVAVPHEKRHECTCSLDKFDEYNIDTENDKIVQYGLTFYRWMRFRRWPRYEKDNRHVCLARARRHHIEHALDICTF